ncbi:MAG TPA: elongation factor G [Spirochaetota bacterium]|nr:elongation factor G [Spirochaetota bacterium]HPJ34673.1 elongation factor G [Spirochaetota bacterium]
MLKEYKADQIRNVAIIGHGGTGKSTLLEAMLFVGGKIDKMGSSDSGNLVSDFDDDEKAKKISIKSSMGFVEFEDVKINIIDTPGTADFIGEARSALQAVETAILVVDSVDGVQIETEKAWRYLTENNIPRIVFVNKMDKERASYDKVIENIKSSLGGNIASLCIPNGEGENFNGVMDTVEMKLYTPKGDGKDVTIGEIPADQKELVELEKTALVELAAEGTDELIEKFLGGEELTPEEVISGLMLQLKAAKLTPVICGSSQKVIGIKNLIKTIKNFAPAPETGKVYTGHQPGDAEKTVEVKLDDSGSMAAVVWKTAIDQYAGRFNYVKVISGQVTPDTEILNAGRDLRERSTKLCAMIGNKQNDMPKICAGDIGVLVKLDKAVTLDTLSDPKNPVVLPIIDLPQPVYSLAVEAAKRGEEDKIGQFLNKVAEENPTLKYGFTVSTSETVLSGMGDMQLNLILNNLKEKLKLDVVTRTPRVAYRETITKKAEAQYKHKKQSGGHGQYGEVQIRVKPLERGKGFEFVDSIVGGVVPKQYIPGVEKGLKEGLEEGVLAKYPVVDVWVELFYGSYHDVDSSEMAFKIAARNAIKNAMEAGGPQLLEPIMNVRIFADKEFMGDIMSDITSRRGRVLGMDSDENSSGIQVIRATVPEAEMLRYSTDLRAMTSGKATFEMEFSHYDPISGREADKIIEERKKFLEEEANK